MAFKKFSLLDDFEIPTVSSVKEVKEVLSKVNRVATVKKSTSNFASMSLDQKIKYVNSQVLKTLGRYKNFVRVIRTPQELEEYIDKAVKLDVLALDTETNNSLDPLTCKLMGLCLYLPNTRPVYVPVNHCKPGTDELLPNQVNESEASRIMHKLVENNTKIIYHNGKFDIRVIHNTLGFYLPIWWDTMLAAQLLDENEPAGLKFQFSSKLDPTIGSYSIEKLFDIPYKWIDPEIFALYSAIDAYDTYNLQQLQQKEFNKPGMERLFNLFHNIETPVSLVVTHMEEDGVTFDNEFVAKLDALYNERMNSAIKTMENMLSPYKSLVEKYQSEGKLETPVNFNSTQQLEIILYTILGLTPVKTGVTESGGTTSEASLVALKNPFADTLLEYRHYAKMITAYTSALPKLCSPKDGKIHSHFHQMGKEGKNVVTGRFSSSDPNLQQMPAREKIMRLMFKGSTEYKEREVEDNSFEVSEIEEIETSSGYVFSRNLKIGDLIYLQEGESRIERVVSKVEEIDRKTLRISVQ